MVIFMNKCSFCGYGFSNEAAVQSCGGCALYRTCGKLKCPRCGYEIPKEPGIISWYKKRKGDRQNVK